MQHLVEIIMNSLCEVQIDKSINDSYYRKSEQWMKSEYDENVLDYWKKPNGNNIVKMKKPDRLDDDCDFKNSLPMRLGSFFIRQ